MDKPQEGYWTNASIDFLSDQLCLPNNVEMQDWAFEVADPSELDKYLSVFSKVYENEDARFTLADVIIQAFEELDQDLERDNRLNLFLDELAKNQNVHASQIWYWAAYDSDLKDAWRVTPFMRSLFRRPA